MISFARFSDGRLGGGSWRRGGSLDQADSSAEATRETHVI